MDPVLKWAGGKRQLLSDIKELITPESLVGHTLFEPFAGGGAVFLSYEHTPAVINDYNCELMNVYSEIRNNPQELLEEHKLNHCEAYFYKIRDLDRTVNYKKITATQKAARIIYLNRTCFNGLYRVNSDGYFNVPFGKYINPDIVTRNRILEMSQYLQKDGVTLLCGDFEEAVSAAKQGDTIYFDPPYDYEDDGFTSYTADAFSRLDLIRLKTLCDKLTNMGCHIVVSNNDTSFVRQLFDSESYTIHSVLAKRMINCNG